MTPLRLPGNLGTSMGNRKTNAIRTNLQACGPPPSRTWVSRLLLGMRKAFAPDIATPFETRTGSEPLVSRDIGTAPMSREAPAPLGPGLNPVIPRGLPVPPMLRVAPAPASPLNLPPPAQRPVGDPVSGSTLVSPFGARPGGNGHTRTVNSDNNSGNTKTEGGSKCQRISKQ